MATRMPRSLYALIPLGFVLLVGILLWVGRDTGGPVAEPSDRSQTAPTAASSSPVDPEVVSDPDGVGSDVVPTPSGPEGRDNEVIFEDAPAPSESEASGG